MRNLFLLVLAFLALTSSASAQKTARDKIIGTWVNTETVNDLKSSQTLVFGVAGSYTHEIKSVLGKTVYSHPFASWSIDESGIATISYGVVTETKNGVKTVDSELSYTTFQQSFKFEGKNVLLQCDGVVDGKDKSTRYVRIK